MRFLAECLLFAFCFKQHQDDEQTFADQLEQQPSSHSKVEQPEPGPEPVPVPVPDSELEPELDAETLRPAQPEQSTPAAVAMRGSHSPARLEEINICADVHPIKLLPELPMPMQMQMQLANEPAASGERNSGVAVKDEIEIFTDVDLGNGAHYFAF